MVRRIGAVNEVKQVAVGSLESSRPPAFLSREAKAEWRRVVGYVADERAGSLLMVDRAALVGYCVAWAMFVEAAGDVARRGVLVPGRSSADQARGDAALVKNPALQIWREAQASLRAWCRELRFTPDTRGRMQPAEAPEWIDDDTGDLFPT